MKFQPVLFIALAVFMLTACNQTKKQAREYHDNLLHSVQVVIDSSLEYGDAIQSHDKDRAVSAQQQYSSLVNRTIAQINAAQPFDGDTTLKHYSLELLTFYRTSLDNDFTPFLNSIKSSSLNEQQSLAADSLYTKLTMTENKYWERFDWAEKKFIKQYDLGKLDN